MKSLYEILDLTTIASVVEIKLAFRRLAKETHPALNGNNPSLTQRFHEVAEAYAILSDPKKRAAYDVCERENAIGSRKSTYKTEYWYDDAKAEAIIMESLIRQLYEQLHEQAQPAKSQAVQSALKGLAWSIGGILLTLLTYKMAVSAGSGIYYVYRGMLFFGPIQVIRAFSLYSNTKDAIEQELWRSLQSRF